MDMSLDSLDVSCYNYGDINLRVKSGDFALVMLILIGLLGSSTETNISLALAKGKK